MVLIILSITEYHVVLFIKLSLEPIIFFISFINLHFVEFAKKLSPAKIGYQYAGVKYKLCGWAGDLYLGSSAMYRVTLRNMYLCPRDI